MHKGTFGYTISTKMVHFIKGNFNVIFIFVNPIFIIKDIVAKN